MKKLQFGCLLLAISLLIFSFSRNYQDAKKDAVIITVAGGACKGGLVNTLVKNNSTTQKIDVVIVRKETGSGLTSTSSTKYSGLPPGYKQPVGCGGTATKDSLVITYTVGAAAYSK